MSDLIQAAVLEVAADMSQFEAQMARGGQAAKKFETDATQAAGKGSQALSGMGKGATEAAGEVDRATRQIVSQIERATATAAAGGRGTAQFFEQLGKLRGADANALAPYIAQLRETEKAAESARLKTLGAASSLQLAGISAGQAGNALRQLPAQFTDIFTSLAAGQPALTVFLQQGGQIRDTFGGFGNAFRAIGSLISPTVLGLTAIGGAVAAIGLAYKQGSGEADAYARSLALTGDASGKTVDQLTNMSLAIDQSVGTQAKAAEVLAQLVGSGKVAGGALEQVAQAAIRLDQVGGQALEKTIEQFVSLGRDPVSAAKQLNESTNFLTLEIYRQIKALQEAGKEAEAAALAQTKYAEAVEGRAKTLEGRLGSLERAWLGVKNLAKEAWDAMLNIGRPDTLEDQLKGVEEKLSTFRPNETRPLVVAERSRLQQQADALRLQIYGQQEAATAAAARAEATKRGIKADEDAAAAAKKHAAELEKLAKAGQDLLNDAAGALFAEEQAASLAKLTAGERDALKAMEALRDGKVALNDADKKRLTALLEQRIAQEDITKGFSDLVDAEVEAEKKLTAIRKEAAASYKQFISLYDRQADAAEQALRNAEDEARAVELAARSQISLAEAVALVGIERLRERQIALLGNEEAVLQVEREIQARQRLIGVMRNKEVRDANMQAARDMERAWLSIYDSVGDGLADALMRGGDDAADYLKRLFARLVLQPVINSFVSPFAGAVASLVTGYGGPTGGNSYGSAINGASNLYSLYGAAGGTVWGSSAAYGAAIGTANFGAGSQAAMLAAQTGEFGFAGTAATSSAAAGAGSGAASWASSLGPYAWAALILYAMFGDFSKFSLGTVAEGLFDGNKLKDANLGDFVFGDNPEKARGGALEQPLDYLGTLIEDAAKRFGANLDDVGVSLATDLDREGLISGIVRIVKDGAIVAGTQTGSGAFGEGRTTPVWDEDALQVIGQSIMPAEAAKKLTEDELQKWFGTQLPTVIIQALQASDLSGRFGEYFDSVSSGLLTDAKASEMLATANAVDALTKALTPLGGAFSKLSLLGVQATADFANSLGGFDAVSGLVNQYVQDFYSEAERTALATSALQGVFAQFNTTMPTTREQFRALVDAQDLTTEAGQKFFAALIGIADDFAAVVPGLEEASQSSAKAKQIAEKRFELENSMLRVQGREYEAVARERQKEIDTLNALDPALGAMLERLYEMEDAAKVLEGLMRFPGGAATSIGQLQSGQSAIAETGQMRQLIDAFEKELNTTGSVWKRYVDEWWRGAIPAVTRGALFNNFAIGELGKEATRLAVDAEAEARRQQGIQNSGGIADPRIAKLQSDQLKATEDLINSLDRVEASLNDYIDSLLTGSLSALSPEQQFEEARRQFDSLVAQGLGGDTAAADKADEAATRFLEIAKTFNSEGGYSAIFNDVVAKLQAMADKLSAIEVGVKQGTITAAQVGTATVATIGAGNDLQAQALATSKQERSANVG